MGIISGHFSFIHYLVWSLVKRSCDATLAAEQKTVPIVTESGNNESDRRADRRADIQMAGNYYFFTYTTFLSPCVTRVTNTNN